MAVPAFRGDPPLPSFPTRIWDGLQSVCDAATEAASTPSGSVPVTTRRRRMVGSFHILAPALARKQGVKLTIGGDRAYATHGAIFVPSLPADDDTAAILAFGHLWHEGNHHKHSDFDALEREKLTGFTKAMHGALEDIYSDARGFEFHPGARQDRDALLHLLQEMGRLNVPQPDSSPAMKMESYVYWRLASDIWRLPNAAPFARQAEDLAVEAFSSSVMVKVDAVMAGVRSCKSTTDCIALSRRMATLIEDESQDPPQEEPSHCGDDSQSTDTGPSGASSEGTPDAGQPPRRSSLSPSSGDKPTPEQRAALAQCLQADDGDHMPDLGSVTAQALEFHAAEHCDESFDVPETPRGFSPDGVTAFGNQRFDLDVRRTSNAVRQKCARLLVAETRRGVRLRTSGTKVDARRLTALSVGDFRVFARHIDPKISTDTAVMLLADRSGSTSGVISVIREALYASALALENINRVSVAAAAFPAGNGGVIPLKHFAQRAPSQSGRFASLSSDGGTPMAQAMLWSGQQLAAQRNERKLLLVVTDGDYPEQLGMPVLRALASSGINCYAIGVGPCADVPWFPYYRKITSVNELPQAMFDVLMFALQREGRRN